MFQIGLLTLLHFTFSSKAHFHRILHRLAAVCITVRCFLLSANTMDKCYNLPYQLKKTANNILLRIHASLYTLPKSRPAINHSVVHLLPNPKQYDYNAFLNRARSQPYPQRDFILKLRLNSKFRMRWLNFQPLS